MSNFILGLKNLQVGKNTLFIIITLFTLSLIYIIPNFHIVSSSIRTFLYSIKPAFPENGTGILVLKLFGDDDKNSLQRDIVSSLNEKISNKFKSNKIFVKASYKSIDESKGIIFAQNMAKTIGRKNNAKIVIWGNLIGKTKFHPRITIIEDSPCFDLNRNKMVNAKKLDSFELPPEIINYPIYLLHIISGFIHVYQENYDEATNAFERALDQNILDNKDLIFINIHLGISNSYAASKDRIETGVRTSKIKYHFLQKSIEHFNSALKLIAKEEDEERWANIVAHKGLAHINFLMNLKFELAVLLADLFNAEQDNDKNKVDRLKTQLTFLNTNVENSKNKAINYFNEAMTVFTKEKYPSDWAGMNFFIGKVYILISGIYGKRSNINNARIFIKKAIDNLPEDASECLKKVYKEHYDHVLTMDVSDPTIPVVEIPGQGASRNN